MICYSWACISFNSLITIPTCVPKCVLEMEENATPFHQAVTLSIKRGAEAVVASVHNGTPTRESWIGNSPKTTARFVDSGVGCNPNSMTSELPRKFR